MTALRQRMLEDLQLRNYAPSTVECYVRSVAEFAKHFNRSPDLLGAEEIRSWQLFLIMVAEDYSLEKQVPGPAAVRPLAGKRARKEKLNAWICESTSKSGYWSKSTTRRTESKITSDELEVFVSDQP